jgi:arylsulfatase
LAIPCQAFVFEMIQTLIEFPPRQKPASFSLSQVMAKLQSGMPSA